MIQNTMQQRTQEWFNARVGKVTASEVYKICVKTSKGSKSTSYDRYKEKIITEILTNIPAETGICTHAMQWGIDNEQDAKKQYEFMFDAKIIDCGFIIHPTMERVGASPDGMIGNDGLIEIKCPTSETHTRFLTSNKISEKHLYQMQLQLACTQRKWCDFVSYDPRFEMPEIQLKRQRIFRDDEFITNMQNCIKEFFDEVDDDIKKILENSSI